MSPIERLQRARLGSTSQIAKGGQARLYLAPDLTIADEDGPFVFKEYRNKRIPISGLDGMTTFRQRLDDQDRAVLDVVANWPLRVVEGDPGATEGVVIPLIPADFFHEIARPDGSRKRIPRDGQYLAQPIERCQRVGLSLVGLGDRYRFCRDLALAVGFMHRRGVCLGDISLSNLVYALHLHPCVYLVDCDAFRLQGQAPVVPQLHTPDWVPPEGPKVQSMRTDRYKLGLLILRTLAPRVRSAQNYDPAWADPNLGPRGRYLLRKALAADAAEDRTTAKAWFSYFNEALRTTALATTAHRSRMPSRVSTTAVAGAAQSSGTGRSSG